MRENRFINKSVFILLSVIIITIMIGYLTVIATNDSKTSYQTELKLKNIVEQYGEENIIFEDGFILSEGDTVKITDIFQNISSESSFIIENENILSFNESGLEAVKEGTTFLLVRNNDKYHVMEAYVASEDVLNREKVQEVATSKESYKVYIDAGHGGTDTGAIGNGIYEKNINLSVGLKIRDKLQDLGVEVVMNRETDIYVNFKDTVIHTNAEKPDIFVSIHHNSATATSASGIETFYTKDIDLKLAEEIQSNLIKNTGAINRGVKYNTFYVTRYTNMPAVLTENGFISNAAEAAKLKTDSYQEIIADSIVDGIMNYLKENIELSVNKIDSERLYGSNRYETSYEIFESGWETANTVLLVTGVDYPDALCAAPLAAEYDAPILLIRNNSLNSQQNLKSLLQRKGVENAYIIGGVGVISETLESELASIGIASKRLGGIDRYETSVMIAEELNFPRGEIAVVNGLGFADGLSISSIASMKNMPILLTQANNIPPVVQDYINENVNVINKSHVIGATGVISNMVANKFINPERIGGSNRYETNVAVFNKFKNELDISEVYLASGLNFADALSVTPLASKNDTFVFLTHPTVVNKSITNTLSQNSSEIDNVYVLGSNKLILNTVLDGLGIFESR